MSNNPLAGLYRKKTVYTKLPSKGKYYPSGITLSIDGELGVMPMTATDEIFMKSPDALFNGEALFNMLKSCAPDIKNPEEIPACDLDVILMAIKIATSGQSIDIVSECPACKEENEYEINLANIMGTAKEIDDNNQVDFEDMKVKVFIRPYSLKSQIKTQLQKFYNYRMEMLLNQENMSSEQKAKLFDEALVSAAEISVQLVTDNILKVEIADEDGETTIVEEPEHIRDWVSNMDSPTYNKIISAIRKSSTDSVSTLLNLSCSNCTHQYKTNLELDPFSFFMLGQ